MFFWISLHSLKSFETDDPNAITVETILECQIMFAGTAQSDSKAEHTIKESA